MSVFSLTGTPPGNARGSFPVGGAGDKFGTTFFVIHVAGNKLPILRLFQEQGMWKAARKAAVAAAAQEFIHGTQRFFHSNGSRRSLLLYRKMLEMSTRKEGQAE